MVGFRPGVIVGVALLAVGCAVATTIAPSELRGQGESLSEITAVGRSDYSSPVRPGTDEPEELSRFQGSGYYTPASINKHSDNVERNEIFSDESDPSYLLSIFQNRMLQNADEGKLNKIATTTPKIIDGYLVDVNKYGWMGGLVTVASGKQYICGANYIGSFDGFHFVLTAAHCISQSFERAIAVFNTNNLRNAVSSNDTIWLINYHTKVIHESYNPVDILNDVGIVIFNDEIDVEPTIAYLADHSLHLEDQETVSVIGYGYTAYNIPGDDYTPAENADYELREVEMQIFPDDNCAQIYHNVSLITDMESEVCAFSKGKGSCHGDSGGPLIATRGSQKVVVGLVSWGVQCADTMPIYPDVYTRISFYKSWIEDAVYSIAGSSSFLRFYGNESVGDSETLATENFSTPVPTQLSAPTVQDFVEATSVNSPAPTMAPNSSSGTLINLFLVCLFAVLSDSILK